MSGDDEAVMNLARALDGMFATAFGELPEHLWRDVARRFHPFRWDDLSPAQRQTLALAADGETPGQEDEFSRHWKLYAERAELLRQVSDWWQVATPTATDKAIQEGRIAALREQIEEVDKAIDDFDLAPEGASAGEPEGTSTGEPEDADEWALKPWMRERRADAITVDIEAALGSLGETSSPTTVMAYLKNLVGKPGTSVFDSAPDGVLWRRYSGKVEKLTEKGLTDRLSRIRKRTSTLANALSTR